MESALKNFEVFCEPKIRVFLLRYVFIIRSFLCSMFNYLNRLSYNSRIRAFLNKILNSDCELKGSLYFLTIKLIIKFLSIVFLFFELLPFSISINEQREVKVISVTRKTCSQMRVLGPSCAC